MKILLTSDWYKPIVNGVVTSVVNLKKELEERGHEVKVLTLSPTYESKCILHKIFKSGNDLSQRKSGSSSCGKIYSGID